MGLFDFFKSKNKSANSNKPVKAPVEADLQGKFNLQFSDFGTRAHSVEVISVTVSPDFYELFPEAKKPAGPGKRNISTSIAEIVFWSKVVEVTFSSDLVSNGSEVFIGKINDQLNWLIKSKDLVDEVIIRDLLPLKNSSWLADNEAALTGERLINTISINSTHFDEKAGISLYYDDGGMFEGHTIVIEINSKRKIKEASIAG